MIRELWLRLRTKCKDYITYTLLRTVRKTYTRHEEKVSLVTYSRALDSQGKVKVNSDVNCQINHHKPTNNWLNIEPQHLDSFILESR